MSKSEGLNLSVKGSLGWLARLENVLLGVGILALVGLAAWQIISRAMFNQAWIHSDALIRQGVLWLTVLGALAATRERKHIAIELDPQADQRAWAAIKARVVSFIAGGFCLGIAWYGWQLVRLEQEGGSELLPGVPLWWSLLIVPVGFALMALRFALQSLRPGKERS